MQQFAIICLVSIAAYFDLRNHLIPNWLTYPAIMLGIGYAAGFEMVSLSSSVMAGGIAFIISLLFFIIRVLGGGDVKLLAAIGCWVGVPEIFEIFIYIILAGGATAIIILIAHGKVLHCIRGALKGQNDDVFKIKIPFALPIAIGTMWALFLPSHLLV